MSLNAPIVIAFAGNESFIEEKFQSRLNPWGDYLFGFVLLLIAMVSLLGNSLAIRVFRYKDRKITVPEIFLLNIAALDLILAMTSCSAPIVAAFSHRWIFGEIGCKIYGVVCYFLGLSSIMILTALALYRFLKISYPHKVEHVTPGKSCWTRLIIPIYLYSLIWTLVPFFGFGGYDVEPFGLSCCIAWAHPDDGARNYIIVASVCCVFLPALIIISSHVGIYVNIRRDGGERISLGKQGEQAEIQFIRVSCGVCFGFLVAWLPYTMISLWATFGDSSSIPMWITPFPIVLAKCSFGFNPVIYVLLNRRYRVEFTSALKELLQIEDPRNDINGTFTRPQH